MPSLPECAWDAHQGIVVLYRDADAASSQSDLALVVRVETGDNAYFAGVLPARERMWAIRAPTEGAFRLDFFSVDSGCGITDLHHALGSLRFDEGIAVDPDAPLGAGEEIVFRVFESRDTDQGKSAAISEHFLVRGGEVPRAFMRDVLARAGKSPIDTSGIVATRSKNGVQGPSVNPLRSEGPLIDVHFTVVKDTVPTDPHGLKIPGFEELYVPAIEVDLSAFGTAAEDMRQGFCFFHRALGSTSDPTWVNGRDIPLDKREGKQVLRWVFDDCCHRDLLGVVFAGGNNLRVRDGSHDGSRMRESFGRTNCIAGLFIGQRYLPMLQESQRFAAMAEKRCRTLDKEAIERRRFCAWAMQDATVAHFRADLQGAADVSAFSLMAYIYFLRHVQQITHDGELGVGTARLDWLGLRFDALADFLVRPDAAFAVIGDEELASRLREAFLQIPDLQEGLGPLSFFAAVFEPDDRDLPGWLDQLPAEEQYVAWRLLISGVRLSPLRTSGWKLDALVAKPKQLVHDLGLLADEDKRRVAAATLADIDQPRELLERPVQQLSKVEPAAALMEQAKQAIREDMGQVESQLRPLGLRSSGNAEVATRILLDGLAQGEIFEQAGLQKEIIELIKEIETNGFSVTSGGWSLRTRVGLIAMREALCGFAAIQKRAGPLIRWCEALMRDELVDFSTEPKTYSGDEHYAVLDKLIAFEEKYAPENGLQLPEWHGDRKQGWQRIVDWLSDQCAEIRVWIGSLHEELAHENVAGGDFLSPLIDRIERIIPWFAAHNVWRKCLDVLKGLEDETTVDESTLQQIRARTTSCSPAEWGNVAEEIDKLFRTAVGAPPSSG